MPWTYEPLKQTWPQLNQDTRPNGTRYYRLPTGESYPSVTTVLHATEPPDAKRGLEEWRRRVGRPVADYISSQARETGTAGHAHMERLLQNPNLLGQIAVHGCDYTVQGHVRTLSAFAISKIRKVHATELYLYSPTLRIAGACDAIITDNDGRRCILDWKCMTHARNARPDYPLQATMYALMATQLLDEDIHKFYVACSAADTGALIVREGAPYDFVDKAEARIRAFHDNPMNNPNIRMVLP